MRGQRHTGEVERRQEIPERREEDGGGEGVECATTQEGSIDVANVLGCPRVDYRDSMLDERNTQRAQHAVDQSLSSRNASEGRYRGSGNEEMDERA